MLEGADPGGPNQTITLRESMKIIPGRRKRTGRRYPRRVCTYTISLFLSLFLSFSFPVCFTGGDPTCTRAYCKDRGTILLSRGSGVSFTCSKFQRCNFTAIVHAIVPLVSAIDHYVLTCRGYFYY